MARSGAVGLRVGDHPRFQHRSCEVDADPYPLRDHADRGLRRDPVLLVAGIWRGFLGSYWDRLWIWVSLILLIGVGIAMTPLAAGPMRRVR